MKLRFDEEMVLGFIFYMLITAPVAFAFMVTVAKIRNKNQKFMRVYDDDISWAVCIGVSLCWILAAPIAFGILGAEYLKITKAGD